jgi:hypothetical protein
VNSLGRSLVAGLFDPVVLGLRARRHEEIEGSLEDFLGVVGEINPAIPARSSQSAGGIVEALEGIAEGESFCIGHGDMIHFIRIGVVLDLVIFHTRTEAIDVFQIRFDVGFPLAFEPGGTRVLQTNGWFCRETRWAIVLGLFQLVSGRIGCNSHVVLLVEVIGAGSRRCHLTTDLYIMPQLRHMP